MQGTSSEQDEALRHYQFISAEEGLQHRTIFLRLIKQQYTEQVLIRINPLKLMSKLKSKLRYDRRPARQSVSVSRTHLGPKSNFSITVRELRVCWCGQLSLKSGRVCRLQLRLTLASAVMIRSDSRGTHDNILLPEIPVFSNPQGQVPVFSEAYVHLNISV
jgi:hypothetical protein